MPQTVEQLAADVKWSKDALEGDRIAHYKTERAYYRGDQKLTFATSKFQQAFANLFESFTYNRCGTVVDATADRIKLHGFSTVGLAPGQNDDNQELNDIIWRRNQMDKKQADFIREALTVGDGFFIVWPELQPDGQLVPKFYVQDSELIAVKYDDDTKRKVLAVKRWRIAGGADDGKWRINLYYPDNTYKYITKAKKDDPPKEIAELDLMQTNPAAIAAGLAVAEPNPLPNPYNTIPVFHYARKAKDGQYGISELHDVIPLQDALNKACTDMMVAMEYGAFPQRWATGLQLGLPDPITGKVPSPFTAGPGEVWTGPDAAKFGDFDVTNLQQFVLIQDSFDTKISNVARIPIYWLNMGSGTPPSGEAFKTSESPFVTKLSGIHTEMGNTFEEAWQFALLTMGKPDVVLEAVWKSAEIRSERDKAEVAQIRKSYGYSNEELQRQDGLSEDQIENMKAENQAAVEEAQAAFSAGLGTGVPPGGGNEPPEREQEE